MGFGKINLRGSRPLVPKINLGLNWKPAPKWWFWILFNHLEMPDIFSFPCFSERGIKIEQLCSIGNMEISLELLHSDIFKAKRMNSTSISIPPSWAAALTRKGDTTTTFPPTEPFRTKINLALFCGWAGRQGRVGKGNQSCGIQMDRRCPLTVENKISCSSVCEIQLVLSTSLKTSTQLPAWCGTLQIPSAALPHSPEALEYKVCSWDQVPKC